MIEGLPQDPRTARVARDALQFGFNQSQAKSIELSFQLLFEFTDQNTDLKKIVSALNQLLKQLFFVDRIIFLCEVMTTVAKLT